MPKHEMTWKQARKVLLEMLADDELCRDWSTEYREAVLIGIERIEEVEDLQGTEDYA